MNLLDLHFSCVRVLREVGLNEPLETARLHLLQALAGYPMAPKLYGAPVPFEVVDRESLRALIANEIFSYEDTIDNAASRVRRLLTDLRVPREATCAPTTPLLENRWDANYYAYRS